MNSGNRLLAGVVLVPTTEGDKPFINLDNAASTPTFAPIWKAVCLTWGQPGEIQKEIINEVRSVCSGLLNAPPDRYDIIFTSNTTESINLAAESLSNESENGTEPVVINTILEHTSNDLPWRMVPNVQIIRLPVDNDGFIDLKVLERMLREYNKKGQHGKKRIRIVTVSGASNVLGICNNLTEISRIVRENGARLFVDGAQLVAHRKIEMEKCGIDYLAFSAHKVYAPFGTGVLLAKKGILKFSQAEMELITLSGEQNATGIAALGKSLLLLKRIGMDLIMKEEQALTVAALHGLSKIPDLTIYGIKDPESPGFAQKGGVIVFSLKKMMANRVAGELAEQGGIGVRYGCHCAHILIKHLVGVPPAFEPLQGLIAKLFPGLRFPGLVRMSIGIGTSEEDIDTMIKMLYKIASQPRNLPKTDIKHRMNEFVSAAARKVFSKI